MSDVGKWVSAKHPGRAEGLTHDPLVKSVFAVGSVGGDPGWDSGLLEAIDLRVGGS